MRRLSDTLPYRCPARTAPALHGLLLAAGWTLTALLAQPAHAKEGDTFRPFVSLGYFYDSNLFRLAEDESPGTQRDDRYSILSAGINVDWKPGRQQIVANATKTLIRYDQNTFVNFDGDDVKATWNWRLGNRLSGNLGASKTTRQSSFDDIGLVNNQVDRERRYGRAEWEFHPRWRIGAGVEEVDNTNSAPSQASQDFQQQAQDVVLAYHTPKGSKLQAQVRRIDAEFPTPQLIPVPPFFAIALDNSFTQTEYNLLGDWQLSAKTIVHGKAGWVERKYDNILRNDYGGLAALAPRPDFSGFAGRLTGDWYATEKTLLSVSAYQELGGAQDIRASSVLKRGASVNGAWAVREKWRVNAGATFENRDFRGDPGSGLPQRNDDTWDTSLSLNYMPIETVSLDVGLRTGRRDSSISGGDYKFHSLFANVRADF